MGKREKEKAIMVLEFGLSIPLEREKFAISDIYLIV